MGWAQTDFLQGFYQMTHGKNNRRFDVKQVKQAAKGRWLELLPAITGIESGKLNGTGCPCPKCGGDDRFSEQFGDNQDNHKAKRDRKRSKTNGVKLGGMASGLWRPRCYLHSVPRFTTNVHKACDNSQRHLIAVD